MANIEKRRFKMHDALLVSVIQRQAGSLWKGVLEGIQNAIDAGAASISVIVTDRTIEIIDDGKGFQTDYEVEQYFETFGTPHEEGDAVFGRFRMGRGQLFNYGKTTYRTGPFRFVVDIANGAMGYELTRDLERKNGCHVRIDLYEHLGEEDQFQLDRALRRAVAYVATPIELNGERISTDPDTVKWDLEDDDAYYRFARTSTLKLYHLGCYIMDVPASSLGSGGVVVAKKHLLVNMARNAIDDKCPIWQRIRTHFEDKTYRVNYRRPALSDDERQNMIYRLIMGKCNLREVRKLRLLRTSTGSRVSFDQVFRALQRGNDLSFSDEGDRIADYAITSGIALVLDRSVLDEFGVESAKEWEELINNLLDRDGIAVNQVTVLPFEKLSERIDTSFEVIPERLWTPLQKAWISAIRMTDKGVAGYFYFDDEEGGSGYGHRLGFDETMVRLRRVTLGTSTVANAWTDGKTYIAVSREFLDERKNRDLADCVRVAELLLHEYCHADSSCVRQHGHDEAFYRLYHDTKDFIPRFSQHLLTNLKVATGREGRKTTTMMRRVLDRQRLLQHQTNDLLDQVQKIQVENERLEMMKKEKDAARKALREAKKQNARLAKAAGGCDE